MSKIKEIYGLYKKGLLQGNWYDPWDDKVVKIASQSDKEMNVLISLFEKEKDVFDKLRLSDLLARLFRKEIVTFLKKVIKTPSKKSSNPNNYKPDAVYNLLTVDYQNDTDAPMWIFDYINDREGLMGLYQGYLWEIDTPASKVILEETTKRLREMGETLES